MTTHHADTTDEVADGLRRSLRERATDVEVTPELYERVQRQAARGTWLRRGLALAGAAAVLVAAVVVVPDLLAPGPVEPDIADTPDEVRTGAPDEDLVATLLDNGLVVARDGPGATSEVLLQDLAVRVGGEVTGLDAHGPTGLVAVTTDRGDVGWIEPTGPGRDGLDNLYAGQQPNGGGVALSPDGSALAWIEGSRLLVVEIAAAPGDPVEVELDVPDGLRLEQWAETSDGQVLLATEPDDATTDPPRGLWQVPLEGEPGDGLAPAGEAEQLDELTLDAGYDADGRLVQLVPGTFEQDGTGPRDEALLRFPEGLVAPPTAPGAELATVRLAVERVTAVVHDPATGIGALVDVADGATDAGAVLGWEAPDLQAVVPLDGDDVAQDEPMRSAGGDAEAVLDARLVWIDNERLLRVGEASVDLGDTGDGDVGRTPALAAATGERVAVLRNGFVRTGVVDGATVALGSLLTASPDVGGVALSPNGAAVAWIDDGTLVVHADATSRTSQRVALGEEVPADLRLEDWVDLDDGSTELLASDDDGGIWSVVLDVGTAGSALVEPPRLLEGTEDAIDVVWVEGLEQRVVLEVFPDGSLPARLRVLDGVAGSPVNGMPLGAPLSSSTGLRLTGNGGWTVAVVDPASGDGALLHLDRTGRHAPVLTWSGADLPIRAAAPFERVTSPADLRDEASDVAGPAPSDGDA